MFQVLVAALATVVLQPSGPLGAASRVGSGQQPEQPAWVVEGVPDTVRTLVEGAAEAVGDEEAKRRLREAEDHARAALTGHPSDVGRRFALAVVLGLRANREGGRSKVRAASALYEELQVILELDPEHARARHLLGRLHAGVRRMNRITRWLATNLLGGGVLEAASWEEAERHLRFAEERAPEVSDHHLQLGNLLRDTGRPAEAVAELEHVLRMPATSPLEREVLAEAAETYERLGGGNPTDAGSGGPT